MDLVITLIVTILLSLLFSQIAKKLNLSVVIGLIIAGLLLGFPPVKNILLEPNTQFILGLGEFGFLTLMFIAGLEISWSMMYEERKDAISVASLSAVIPIFLGASIFLLLGYNLLTSLTVGICMGITAQATNAVVLLEIDKLKTKVGSLIMGAGIIDDLLGLSLFVLISYLFLGVVKTEEFTLTVGGILAFLFGILIHRYVGRKTPYISFLEMSFTFLLIPFFFVGMGIHFSFQALILDLWLLILVVIVSIAGKMSGSLSAKILTGLSWKQHYLIGWGMNSRGAVELAIAFLGFEVGLLSVEVFSSLVLMALITTLLFPVFIREMVRKDPFIME